MGLVKLNINALPPATHLSLATESSFNGRHYLWDPKVADFKPCLHLPYYRPCVSRCCHIFYEPVGFSECFKTERHDIGWWFFFFFKSCLDLILWEFLKIVCFIEKLLRDHIQWESRLEEDKQNKYNKRSFKTFHFADQ